jgi:hypothetical protein
MMSASRSFVDAHRPHRPCALPLFARVHIDPCELSQRRRPRPSASFENACLPEHRRSRLPEDHLKREGQAARQVGGCGGDLRSRSRSARRAEADRSFGLGTLRWGKRDVLRPAVLLQRRTPKPCAAPSLQRGRQLAAGDVGMHARRVHPPRARILNGSASSRRRATSPAAWPFVPTS